jgi:hypothetical protein
MESSFVRTGLLGAALFCGAMACNGMIDDANGLTPSTGAAGVGGPAGTAGTGSAGTGNGGAGNGAAGTAVVALPAGSKGVHRLNSTEYNATIADVLGTKLQPANSSWLGGEIHGFDNIAAVLDVDEAQFQRYFDAAGTVADDVFATADAKAKIMTCATTDAACVQGIIGATGRRLFRRPLEAAEVTTYKTVYDKARELGETHEGSVKQVLRALLSSSDFIYRVELDPNPASNVRHPLSGYELASRLSYFLWSSAPDDTLLAAAGDGSLMNDAAIVATVDRLLADPIKGQRFVENFSGQWLGARKLPNHATEPAVFPDWTTPVAQSLTKEMYLYFAEFVKTDRPWSEFMTADFNFVDANTAKFYGVAAPAGGAMTRTVITTDKRVGFAGLAGFLAASSLPARTSPTMRGGVVLKKLLCKEPPPPPPGVPDLGGAGGFDPTKNVKVALEQHRTQMSCAVCHAMFDPFGMALEQYDGIGKYRTTYNDGSTIDPTGVLAGQSFSGVEGVAQVVANDPRFSSCVTEFLFTYGMGREPKSADTPDLTAVETAWKAGTPSFRRLIQTLALSQTFRTRHGGATN